MTEEKTRKYVIERKKPEQEEAFYSVFIVFKNGEVDSVFWNEGQAEAQRKVLQMRWNITRIEEKAVYGLTPEQIGYKYLPDVNKPQA